jgi:hypothetical protein
MSLLSSYQLEVTALRALDAAVVERIARTNTLNFLGRRPD